MRTENFTCSQPAVTCSVIISKTKCKPTGYNILDELVSVSPSRLRWLEKSGAVIELSDLLIEINHEVAATLLYRLQACYQYICRQEIVQAAITEMIDN